MNFKFFIPLVITVLCSCRNNPETTETDKTKSVITKTAERKRVDFEVTPIEHASAVFHLDSTVFYIDPVGGAGAYVNQPKPNVILVTDIHGDHFNAETLEALAAPTTKIIVPQAVADKLDGTLKDRLIIVNNGETKTLDDIDIRAIPMYNLREEAKEFHTKGRGNGYVITKGDMKVYFSGDTEDIPEMRNLKDIDVAFVCMNLPYTMTIKQAVDAVLAFKPKKVYPYHYRGKDGLSDVAKFKTMVTQKNPDIEVVQLDWYPDISE